MLHRLGRRFSSAGESNREKFAITILGEEWTAPAVFRYERPENIISQGISKFPI